MSKTYLLVVSDDDKGKDLNQYSLDAKFLGSLQAPLKDNKLECHLITRAAFNKLKANANIDYYFLDNTTFINKYLNVDKNTSIIIVTIKHNATGTVMTQQDDILKTILKEIGSMQKDISDMKEDIKELKLDVAELKAEAKAHG